MWGRGPRVHPGSAAHSRVVRKVKGPSRGFLLSQATGGRCHSSAWHSCSQVVGLLPGCGSDPTRLTILPSPTLRTQFPSSRDRRAGTWAPPPADGSLPEGALRLDQKPCQPSTQLPPAPSPPSSSEVLYHSPHPGSSSPFPCLLA